MFSSPFLIVTVGASLVVSSPLLARERNGGNNLSAPTNWTSSPSAMLARSQLGKAATRRRASVNKDKRKRATSVPSPPAGPPGIPIPYPNIGATHR
jgi:hypothetical protein